MDQKTKNFFNAVSEIALFNMEAHPQMLTGALQQAINYDFDIAVSLWEFYLEKYETVFLKVKKTNQCLSIDALEVFLQKSEQKTTKAICSSAILKKYLLGESDVAFSPYVINYVVSAVIAGKMETADVFVKSLLKHEKFGKIWMEILSQTREKLLAKHHGATLRLPPKTTNYFNSYAQKIKSSEKAVLLQRIKELS